MSWNILPKNVLQYFLTKLKGLMYTKTEVDNLIPSITPNPSTTTGVLNGLEIDGTAYEIQGSGEPNVQADWDEVDSTADDYIKNKPTIPDISTKVSKSGDTMTGCLIVKATGAAGSYDEGIRINAGKNGYATLCIGGAENSTTGTSEGQFWIGTNPTNNSYKRKLYIAQNGSTGSETYFEADSASRTSPALRLGWSGNVADGNAYAVTGDVVYDYIVSHMLSARPNVSGNMNDVAGFGNSMGMINLSGTDETVNPNGGTSWHHFINISYQETSGSNMWQTQLACKAGTSDIFIRSRSGGSVTAGTAWAAPWIRLVKGIQRVAKSCNWMPGKNGVYFEEYTAGSNYNLPSNAWYHIITMQGADTKYGTQLALGMTTEAVYYRKYDNKTWGSWKSLINTNTTYSANNGVGLSGTTFYNSGVRDISINGNYLRKNVNGTNTDLTIPYATSAGSAGTASNAANAGRASTAGKADFAVYLKNDNGNTYCNCVNNIRATLTSVNTGVELRTGTSANWYLSMQGDGNLVVYQNTTARWNTGTSSRRFKHNIQTMTEERAKKILDIRPVTFDWNDDQPITTRKNDNAGVIAEEVSKIFPDLVVFEDIVDENGNRKTSVERRVEYERFTPYLIKMVQMQQEEINLLKKRIDILEGK